FFLHAAPPALSTLSLHDALPIYFRRATFGGAVRGEVPCPWVKVVVRPVELRGERQLQFSYFDGRKTLTKNFRTPDAAAPLAELLDRKSTRLNSSHVAISYAVFCL